MKEPSEFDTPLTKAAIIVGLSGGYMRLLADTRKIPSERNDANHRMFRREDLLNFKKARARA
jgi:hypothetical protein